MTVLTLEHAESSGVRDPLHDLEPATTASPALVNRLRLAVESDEIDVHFQRTVDLATGEINGVEALARWHDVVFGSVGPSVFIPIAEQHGLIGTLGSQLRRRAVERVDRLQRDGRLSDEITLWTNVSVLELEDRQRVDEIAELGDRVGHVRLGLEITEQREIDIIRISESLERLTSGGFQLALDDFGSGVAAYSLLPHMPLSVMKLDRTLTADVARDPRSRTVVAHLVELAHQLGFAVTAEGIEDDDQMATLGRLGCDTGQGFLLGRPAPAQKTLYGADTRAA